MALLDWLQDHSDEDLQAIVDALEAGELPEAQADRLRELIEAESLTIREEAVQQTEQVGALSLFNQLEVALGLDPTAPPAGPAEVPDGVEIEALDRDREEALNRLDALLEPAFGRDAAFFADIAEALETANAARSSMLSQRAVDALSADDRDTLAERARDLAMAQRREDATLDDFPEVQSALRRGPGRSVTYFEDRLRELRGEAEPERIPADSLEELRAIPDVLEDAIEVAEQRIDALETGTGTTGGDTSLSPAPTGRPQLGRTEPFQDEGYLTGETITRDPQFESTFVQLARDIGRARDLDLFPLPPDDYFQLTPASQRRLYDVTPTEFMGRAVRRGDITCGQLRSRYGFADEDLPGDCLEGV